MEGSVRPRTVNCRTGSVTVQVPYVSQAPQAVRSASGFRWDWAFPACATTSGAFALDECDPVFLTIQFDRLRDISRTAALRAFFRSHSSPPQCEAILYEIGRRCGREVFYVTKAEQDGINPYAGWRADPESRVDPAGYSGSPVPSWRGTEWRSESCRTSFPPAAAGARPRS
jgi:hypothetical protein